MNYLKNHQPSYSDSYLMSMTKKQLIEHIRILEHNIDVIQEQSDNQYKLLSRLTSHKKTMNDVWTDIINNGKVEDLV